MQRLFVGDVQGCAEELLELLARAERNFGADLEVWLVGDLVNRGPGDLRVLEAVRARVECGRARVVLGNHELGMLRLAWGQREVRPADTVQRLLARPDAAEWVDWVRRLPVVATGVLGARSSAMVHAASAPEWELEDLARRGSAAAARLADPEEKRARAFLGAAGSPSGGGQVLDDLLRMVTCRSVTGRGWSPREPAELGGDAVPWHHAWSLQRHRHGIVYGHWSLQGLHCAPGLRGLDTGCVHHGRGRDGFLTGWLPDETRADPFAVPDRGFLQVRARRRYYVG